MDGANGSTSFVDSSAGAVALTATASTLSTTQSKFGGSAGYFAGTGSYVKGTTNSNFTFGTGDFTVEFWVYPLAYGGSVVGGQLFGTTNATQAGFSINLGESRDRFRIISNATGAWADNLVVSAGGGADLNTWNHYAVVRQGAKLTIYKNGTSVATTSAAAAWNFNGSVPVIGRFSDGGTARDFNGYLDDIRVTKGVARYTANFTAPTLAFPNQ
jgi:hypothetical protein